MAICWTAVIAFQNAPNGKCEPFPSKEPCKIQDLYTLNFQSFRVEFIGILRNFCLNLIKSNNNLIAWFYSIEDSMNYKRELKNRMKEKFIRFPSNKREKNIDFIFLKHKTIQ
jgi:hypothetical protein